MKYLTLHDLDEVLELFTYQEKEEEEEKYDAYDEENDAIFGKCDGE